MSILCRAPADVSHELLDQCGGGPADIAGLTADEVAEVANFLGHRGARDATYLVALGAALIIDIYNTAYACIVITSSYMSRRSRARVVLDRAAPAARGGAARRAVSFKNLALRL